VVGASFSWLLAAVRYKKIYTGLAITNLRPLTHKSTTMVGNLKGRDHLEHLGVDGKIFIQMALMEMELWVMDYIQLSFLPFTVTSAVKYTVFIR
jgi:hypothetical protein